MVSSGVQKGTCNILLGLQWPFDGQVSCLGGYSKLLPVKETDSMSFDSNVLCWLAK